MSKALRSYPKVWNAGHPNIAELLDGEVVVQEKIDGSQFSFGVSNGELHCRSKGATVYLETTDKLFRGAVDTAMRLHEAGLLVEGWTYRGEALMGPKHNALAYQRAPAGNVVLFDVDRGLEDRLSVTEAMDVAAKLGLEFAPVYFMGEVESFDRLREYLDRPALLGGRTEGVVIKNYARWGKDGKMLMGKLVADDFREINHKEWKKSNPTRADIIEQVIETYRTETRWQKAVQHLRERGESEGTPRDIGKLIQEVGDDIRAECEAEIKDALFAAFWKDIRRGVVRGLPEWYKRELAAKQAA